MNYNKKLVSELWQKHEPYIRKLCTHKLKSLPDYVDDCIQDVFLDLSDALNKGKLLVFKDTEISYNVTSSLAF